MMTRNRDWQEMPKMCELSESGGKPVYVNPTTVRYVRPGSGTTTVIHFAPDQSTVVAMPIDEVIAALDIAMR